ncbi:MAG: hypothetical protein HY304_06555 [candidate division Zixibacteria bacterium]|nr:hypothetical protein [candidate division Zixibacteria bacterium]
MGEVRVGAFFADALVSRGREIVASAMTETGYALCRDVYPAGATFFRVPFDLPGPVERALGHFQPRALVLVETEWWPNLLTHAGRAGAPVFVINGRISERSFRRYRILAPYWRAVLRSVQFFYMRSGADAERLIALGVESERVAASGTLKIGITTNAASTAAPHAASTDGPIWIAGCTRPGEEEIVLAAFGQLRGEFPNLRLWVAPRHPERFDEVAARRRQSSALRRSQSSGAGIDGSIGDIWTAHE